MKVEHKHTRRSAGLQLALAFPFVAQLVKAYTRGRTIPAMSEAATAFLNSLWPEQRAKATFKLEDDERLNWFYTPVPRKGLPLREMTSGQRQLALGLLSVGLSQTGFAKIMTIMSLEEVLAITDNHVNRRDPDGYFVSIFLDPAETAPSEKSAWSYRFEGHHVSTHFTIADGKLSGAPSFLGTNPARVLEGRRKGLRALPREEDLGRALIHTLSADQKKTAIVLATAPADILTEHSRQAALSGQPNGIRLSAMNAAQGDGLKALLGEYCDNMTEELAAFRREQIRKVGNEVWFAWAGGMQPGDPHYYRIQSPEFLVEFDDTQDNANHIHSVWRDLGGDFGRDLLKEHYQAAH
jgi:hypothetical protein